MRRAGQLSRDTAAGPAAAIPGRDIDGSLYLRCGLGPGAPANNTQHNTVGCAQQSLLRQSLVRAPNRRPRIQQNKHRRIGGRSQVQASPWRCKFRLWATAAAAPAPSAPSTAVRAVISRQLHRVQIQIAGGGGCDDGAAHAAPQGSSTHRTTRTTPPRPAIRIAGCRSPTAPAAAAAAICDAPFAPGWRSRRRRCSIPCCRRRVSPHRTPVAANPGGSLIAAIRRPLLHPTPHALWPMSSLQALLLSPPPPSPRTHPACLFI